MAPLTRSRALLDGTPGPSARLYYAQRASAGLIVSEGTCISPQAVGHPAIPGIWTDSQIEGWRVVTRGVHAAGGAIVLQLWHTGRGSHPSVQPYGALPVAPSAVAIDGLTFTQHGLLPFEAPRELHAMEIPRIVEDYAQAAINALRAGFDGVEIHGANGYLVDQFLHDSANHRNDDWGGTIAKRCRFLFDVVSALSGAVGGGRVGLRLSPSSSFQGMTDSDPESLYECVLAGLHPEELAYLHVVEPGVSGDGTAKRGPTELDSGWVRQRWAGGLIAAGNYSSETAEEVVGTERVDAVAFGGVFLANPDLPERLSSGAALNDANRDTFYSGGDEGYIDYPSLQAEKAYRDLRAADDADDASRGATLSSSTPLEQWAAAWAASRIFAEREQSSTANTRGKS
jgi:N-ethylmaleimide reductase